jgi:hypothetical protein
MASSSMKDLIGIINALLEGLDIRGRWLAVVSTVALILMLLFGFEVVTGWNYYRNLEKKIELLDRLNSLHSEGVTSNPELEPIYAQAVADLSSRNTAPPRLPAIALRTSIAFWKAISGASFWILFALLGMFGTFGKERRALAAIALLIIAIPFGYIGSILPTIGNPWVNYIGFPLLQMAILLIISGRARKSSSAPQEPKARGAA